MAVAFSIQPGESVVDWLKLPSRPQVTLLSKLAERERDTGVSIMVVALFSMVLSLMAYAGQHAMVQKNAKAKRWGTLAIGKLRCVMA